MKIRITEKQLNEVLGVNLTYLNNDEDDLNKYNADSEITTGDKTDIPMKPTKSDDVSKKMAPRRHYGARRAITSLNCGINKKKLVFETNQELKDKQYTIPSNIYNVLKNNLMRLQNSENVEGLQRLKNLVDMKSINHGEMYRLRNHFNNIDKKCEEYNLLGGGLMDRWINNQLETSKSISHNSKELKKNIGMENSFIKKHEKSGMGTAHTKKNNNITFEYE